MRLSPSQQKIVACFKRYGSRMLPTDAVFEDGQPSLPMSVFVLGVRWEWSWTLNQEAHTSDYRRRINELRKKGYRIASFYVGTRHGYCLVAEPQTEGKAGSRWRL